MSIETELIQLRAKYNQLEYQLWEKSEIIGRLDRRIAEKQNRIYDSEGALDVLRDLIQWKKKRFVQYLGDPFERIVQRATELLERVDSV